MSRVPSRKIVTKVSSSAKDVDNVLDISPCLWFFIFGDDQCLALGLRGVGSQVNK